MAAPSLTYTLTNGTTADASQVMQNFNDLLNGITDGSKDLSISALTVAGTATLNGNVTLGNSSADTLTVTASLASGIVPDSTGVRSLGSSAIGFLDLYLAASADADTARIIAASHSADRVYTLDDAGANDSFAMLAATQALTNKTYNKITVTAPATSATLTIADGKTLTYSETTSTVACSSGAAGAGNLTTAIDHTAKLTRNGSQVTCVIYSASQGTKSSTAGYVEILGLVPSGYRPSTIVYCVGIWGISSNLATGFRIDTSGNVRIYNNTAFGNISAGQTTIGSFEVGTLSWNTL